MKNKIFRYDTTTRSVVSYDGGIEVARYPVLVEADRNGGSNVSVGDKSEFGVPYGGIEASAERLARDSKR
tara:strand:+ start:1039 stop:1248 length:210 start_codon:yes stop_codon:yes gene_type:complete